MPEATQSAPYRTFLDRLLADGALPASQIPAALKDETARLVENGVLQWERAGAGRRLLLSVKMVRLFLCRSKLIVLRSMKHL